MIKRYDVVSRGAVAALPVLDASWFAGRSPTELVVALALVAVVALMVAAAAYTGDARRRSRRSGEDDSDLFTTTPLPMSKEELARMGRESPYHAFAPFGLPRWVQLGSLVVAIGITFVAAQRLRTGESASAASQSRPADTERAIDRTDPDDGSPESLDLAPASVAPFSFRAREWIAMDGGCTGRLEVTKGVAEGWNVTVRVHGDRGQLIDTARASVGELREGDLVEFRFPRASCDRIGAWDVSAARRSP